MGQTLTQGPLTLQQKLQKHRPKVGAWGWIGKISRTLMLTMLLGAVADFLLAGIAEGAELAAPIISESMSLAEALGKIAADPEWFASIVTDAELYTELISHPEVFPEIVLMPEVLSDLATDPEALLNAVSDSENVAYLRENHSAIDTLMNHPYVCTNSAMVTQIKDLVA